MKLGLCVCRVAQVGCCSMDAVIVSVQSWGYSCDNFFFLFSFFFFGQGCKVKRI